MNLQQSAEFDFLSHFKSLGESILSLFKNSEDDKKLEAIYNSLHSLAEFTDPKNYKSYSELQAKLMAVLGEGAAAGQATMREERMMNDPVEPPSMKQPVTADEMDGEEDTMSYFSRLAAED